MDIVRVLRLIEYEGPRDLVEKQIQHSVHGTRTGIQSKESSVRITAVTLDQFPQILSEARQIPCPKALKDLQDRLNQMQNELAEARNMIGTDGRD